MADKRFLSPTVEWDMLEDTDSFSHLIFKVRSENIQQPVTHIVIKGIYNIYDMKLEVEDFVNAVKLCNSLKWIEFGQIETNSIFLHSRTIHQMLNNLAKYCREFDTLKCNTTASSTSFIG